MFARLKKSGKYRYLQIVENRKEAGEVNQRVLATLGRMDRLQEKDRIETLIHSLSRFSEKALLILSSDNEVAANAKTIGPALFFDRLWKEIGIDRVIKTLLAGRKFEFDVERAIFLTVLRRLMVSGSDRFCERWKQGYRIGGAEGLDLHHLYRAMSFLGEPLAEQEAEASLSTRCIKDRVEEKIFARNRDLFSGLDLVFFDTTSIYFEGQGGASLGQRGYSKDHRPDLNQMVVGAVIDEGGRPICCQMWPGNTTDVTTLLTVTGRIRQRFGIASFCIVADRGMISKNTIDELEEQQIPYILGCRMRRVKAIRDQVLSHPGRYQQVRVENQSAKGPEPLKVKQLELNGRRYIVCVNQRQATKEATDRQAIVEALQQQLKKGAKSLVGNKGYRRYLKIEKDSARIDMDKVKADSRFDGKWVLTTNTDLSADQVALKYKELWQVEHLFRDVKSILETRPIYHQQDEAIRGHVFCSFLALMLRKELEKRLAQADHRFEWVQIKQDLKALKQIEIEQGAQRFVLRTQTKGVCGKIFQAVKVALPPTIQKIS